MMLNRSESNARIADWLADAQEPRWLTQEFDKICRNDGFAAALRRYGDSFGHAAYTTDIAKRVTTLVESGDALDNTDAMLIVLDEQVALSFARTSEARDLYDAAIEASTSEARKNFLMRSAPAVLVETDRTRGIFIATGLSPELMGEAAAARKAAHVRAGRRA
jgi:hypothetical protein